MQLYHIKLLQHANCTSLDLTNCSIGDEGTEVLANGLHTKMRELTFCTNNISDTGIIALAIVLKNLTDLQTLDISINHIRDSGAEAVSETVQHCTKLATLNMKLNHIGNTGSKALANSLQHLPSLKALDISYNQIGDEGAIAVARAMMGRDISSLQIWNHKITEEGADIIEWLSGVHVDVHILTWKNIHPISTAISILALK